MEENNKEMIKNIIFDIGNVLTDFRWKEFLEEKGFSGEIFQRIVKASVLNPNWNEFDRGALSEEEVFASFVAADPGIERELHIAFDNIQGMVTPRAYAIPWVKSLKEKGYGVYFLSNFSEKAYIECSDALGFLPYMDGGILSYREKVIKPERDIYELLLNRYRLKAEECVFIDDTAANIQAAVMQGFYGIQFITKEKTDKELIGLGVSLE